MCSASDSDQNSPAKTNCRRQTGSKPLKQSTLGFGKISREEYIKQERQRAIKYKEEYEAQDELERMAEEKKLLLKRKKATEKKQRQRANKKARLAAQVIEKVSRPSPLDFDCYTDYTYVE